MRVRTLEPGYALKAAAWSASRDRGDPSLRARITQRLAGAARQVLFPDPQILWQPAAQSMVARKVVLAKRAPDVLFISGPPFSQFLLAPLARLRRHVGVVLDYRDEWSTYRQTYEMMGGRAAALAGEPLEGALLRCAHVVTTATEEFRVNLLARFPFLDPAHVYAIPNGYDPDDFPSDLPSPRSDKFTITYGGTVFKLTSPRGLLTAIRRLHREEPELAKRLEVRFIGRVVETELDAFEGMEQLGVSRIGYLEHRAAIGELAASQLVLCLLDEVAGVERIYPAKIFELMHLTARLRAWSAGTRSAR
jgi:glycosyltransferase involved in cell wall biosynthesis